MQTNDFFPEIWAKNVGAHYTWESTLHLAKYGVLADLPTK